MIYAKRIVQQILQWPFSLEDSDFLDLNADTTSMENCLIKAGRIRYQVLETSEIRDRTKLILKLNQILGFSVEQ